MTDLMAAGTVACACTTAGGRTLGQGADAEGHPLDAVARLARELAALDQRLEAGDWVITGGDEALCAGGGWAVGRAVFAEGRLDG
ncbi:MAG: hypothetical protein R3E56_16910 [Burkholderiaceae bacterium]